MTDEGRSCMGGGRRRLDLDSWMGGVKPENSFQMSGEEGLEVSQELFTQVGANEHHIHCALREDVEILIPMFSIVLSQ